MIFHGRKRHLHSLIGLGVALLLHLLLLIAIDRAGDTRRAAPAPDARLTMVMIEAPPPRPPALRPAPVMPTRKMRPAAPKPAAPQAITAVPMPPTATAPAQPPTAPQAPIDVDAAVKSAGRLQLDDARPVAQLKKQERRMTTDDKLGRDIDKAARPDCRTAHAGKGLFAPLFMAHDALTERGCKW